MPALIIQDPLINKLSPQAEVLFRRLWSVVDDLGLYYGDVRNIQEACWPGVQVDSLLILKSLMELQKYKLITVYPSNGKEYLCILEWQTKWKQGGRAKSSKYPTPKHREEHAITFPLKDGGTWGITKERLNELEATHKQVPVRLELTNASHWLAGNRHRQKTAQGMPRFIDGWIARYRKQLRPAKSGVPDYIRNLMKEKNG